ncbi:MULTISPECIES: YitT family protein [Terrabacteria group]|uniref:YitT family protein n=1 Tax=Bacillati TaxID=1783272 RepID=UPI0019394271|nr:MULTISPECIES: YitT family protein [Terrabacteria group]MBW9212886.1 YitT family protein [Trueperella sp. zg.1013]QRG86488.1 YitT family protein [Bulleidia sp. zg-1006]
MKQKIVNLRKRKNIRLVFSVFMVIMSALIQTFALEVFIRPAGMLASGFTGLAILIHEIGLHIHMNISIPLLIMALNVPVAILCGKSISLRFTLLSSLQFACVSIFLQIFHFEALFQDTLLNIVMGGAVYGFGIVAALMANASTGGTDFIALYVSNKTGKSIWSYVFLYNCVLLCIFGFTSGWQKSCYSMIMQFVATKMIDALYHRYDRSTMQITSVMPEEILKRYTEKYRHGISVWRSYGGYSRCENYMLNTVVSSLEVKEIAHLILEVDPHAIINVYRTDDFYGGFYRRPLD